MRIIRGNLLDSDSQIIVQQTNCVTVTPHGLSASIGARYPYADVYSKRSKRSANTACLNARGIPGTVIICRPEDQCGPVVACMMAQISPGRPGTWCRQYDIDPSTDDAASRLKYFDQCLAALLKEMRLGGYTTVAFPYKIGCGLAGGSWAKYESKIRAFEDEAGDHGIEVSLYRLD